MATSAENVPRLMQVIIMSHTQCLNKRLQNNSCIVNAQTSRSGLNCLGIAIVMIRLALKDLNKLFVGLLLSQYYRILCTTILLINFNMFVYCMYNSNNDVIK